MYYTHVMMYTHWNPYTDKYVDNTIIKLNLHYRQVKQITNREFTICHKYNINTSNSEQCMVSLIFFIMINPVLVTMSNLLTFSDSPVIRINLHCYSISSHHVQLANIQWFTCDKNQLTAFLVTMSSLLTFSDLPVIRINLQHF